MKWFHHLVNKCILKREEQLLPEELDAVLSQTIDLDKFRFNRLELPHTADTYALQRQADRIRDLSSPQNNP